MQTETKTTIAQFIADNRITMTAERVDKNPNNKDWHDADHWKVKLRVKDSDGTAHVMTTYFSKGYGHKGKEPKADEVLDCLASDAAGVENAQSFEDWCSEYGYDTDSRKAEKTYNVCKHEADYLKKWLGDRQYQRLLWGGSGE